jgi:hypothetical protein
MRASPVLPFRGVRGVAGGEVKVVSSKLEGGIVWNICLYLPSRYPLTPMIKNGFTW